MLGNILKTRIFLFIFKAIKLNKQIQRHIFWRYILGKQKAPSGA